MRVVLLVSALFFFVPCSLLAEGEDSCQQTCPEGQVLVSFADGSSAKCLCQEVGSPMQETPDAPIDCVDPEDDGTCE